MYANDHEPLHVHIFKDGKQIDRFAFQPQQFLDGTIGRHRGRVLKALSELMDEMLDDESGGENG